MIMRIIQAGEEDGGGGGGGCLPCCRSFLLSKIRLHFFKNLSSVDNQMLLLPAVLFSITGGGYAYAMAPAYGTAWAVGSVPWLLFLLLASLRLDGDPGDASTGVGRMKWLGIFFPLWVLLLMVVAAHHVLPYVWDIDVFPEPSSDTQGDVRWLSRLMGRVQQAVGAMKGKLGRKRDGSTPVDGEERSEEAAHS